MPVDNNGSHVNKGSIHFLLNRDDIPPSREQTPTTTTADEFRAIPRSHNTFHTPALAPAFTGTINRPVRPAAHLPDPTTGRGNVLLLQEEITEQRTTTTVTRRSVYAQPAPASTGDNFSYNAQGGPLAAAGSGPAYPTGSGGSAGGALPPALTLTPTPHQQPRSSNKGKGPKQGSVLIVPNTYNAGPASSSGADAAQQTDEPEDKAARKRKRNAERQRKCREKKKEIFVLDLPDKIVMATLEQIADPNIRKVSLYTQQTRVRDRKRVLENGKIATPEDIATGKKTTSYTAFCKRAKASTQDAQPLSSHTEHTNNNSGTANSAGAGPANATQSNRTPLEYTGSAAAIVRRFASPSPSLSDSSSLQQHDTPGTHSYQSTRTIDSDDVPLAKRRKR